MLPAASGSATADLKASTLCYPYPITCQLAGFAATDAGADEADPKAGLVHAEPSDGTASEASSDNPMFPLDILCR